MNIGIIKERAQNETRVAVVPSHIPALIKKGYGVLIEKDAGKAAGYADHLYKDKGATVKETLEALVAESDILLTVRSANASDDDTVLHQLTKKHILIGLLEPYSPSPTFNTLVDKEVSSFSMELIPRTTRAQSMDVLSSMANLAGYQSVIIGANESPKMFPMMMTAAGTITPAHVFVLGVGVAGLQAIATAKRLGAVVSAYDVRSEVKEQVESLGAKFVEFDLESAEGEGGYAKKMDDAFYERQRQMMLEELKTKDVVITTANIPGKKAPILITEAMVKAMPNGSVIIDLAAERGGNCELTKMGKTIIKHGVKIVGPQNLPAELVYNASMLYSKNITTYLLNLFTEDHTINLDDDIVKATVVTHKGTIPNAHVAAMIGGTKS
ncbi:MAG: Re/Si-specific NAD(P)(+) transhydrogenase subunit alpha [Bacillota bacterium]